MEEPSDTALVLRARAGDDLAFGMLVDRYRTMGLALALHLSGDRETARDLLQEASLAAFLSLGALRDPSRFRSWFYGTVLNVTRAWRRRQRRDPEVFEGADLDALVDEANDPISDLETRWVVRDALRRLSPADQAAMMLFHYDDLSLEQIAARLGLSLAATKSRLHKGRRRLRELLAPDFPPPTGTRRRQAHRQTSERKPLMTRMNIMNVVLLVSRVLVVLADPPGTRVLPIWLEARHARPLLALRNPVTFAPAASTELAGQLLIAAGGSLREVQIQDLDSGSFYATLVIAGRDGDSRIRAGVADALALAARHECPIVVAESLLAEQGVPVPAGQPIEDVLIRRAGAPVATRQSERPRTAQPYNLDFAAGLQGWELRGSFLHDQTGSRWQDYECGVDRHAGPTPSTASGFLVARAAAPVGYADLRQGVLADPFRGRRVRLTAQVKTRDVTDKASIYLRVVDPARSRGPEHRHQVASPATDGWNHLQVEADVPDDSVFVLFGLSLSGPGQIWATNFELHLCQPG